MTWKKARPKTWVALLAAGLWAQNSSSIAAKCVEALGGAAQFAKIDSIRVHGRMSGGLGPVTKFTVTAKRPNRFRMELDAGHDHVIQAYDGKTGWQSVLGEHVQAPTPLTGESLARLADQGANFIGGPLVEMEQRGNRVELAGREAVGGADCYKLKVTLATGNSITMFIESSKFLEVQQEIPTQVNGEGATIQQTVGDYRKFGGILVACRLVTRQKGGEEGQVTEVESVEINPAIEAGLFEKENNMEKK